MSEYEVETVRCRTCGRNLIPLFLLINMRHSICVVQILDKRRNKYLVRWAGFGPAEDTWEPVENLSGAMELVQHYEAQHNKRAKRHKQVAPTRNSRRLALKRMCIESLDARLLGHMLDFLGGLPAPLEEPDVDRSWQTGDAVDVETYSGLKRAHIVGPASADSIDTSDGAVWTSADRDRWLAERMEIEFEDDAGISTHEVADFRRRRVVGTGSKGLRAGARHLGRLACTSRRFSSVVEQAAQVRAEQYPKWMRAQRTRAAGESCLLWLHALAEIRANTHPLLFSGWTSNRIRLPCPQNTWWWPQNQPNPPNPEDYETFPRATVSAKSDVGYYWGTPSKGTAICGQLLMKEGVHYAEFTLRQGDSARLGVIHSSALAAGLPDKASGPGVEFVGSAREIGTDSDRGWGYRARSGRLETRDPSIARRAFDRAELHLGQVNWEGMEGSTEGDTIGLKLDFTALPCVCPEDSKQTCPLRAPTLTVYKKRRQAPAEAGDATATQVGLTSTCTSDMQRLGVMAKDLLRNIPEEDRSGGGMYWIACVFGDTTVKITSKPPPMDPCATCENCMAARAALGITGDIEGRGTGFHPDDGVDEMDNIEPGFFDGPY